MLSRGGRFRCVLPDLEHAIDAYVRDPSAQAALDFMFVTSLGQEGELNSLWGRVVAVLGGSRHLWMWDYRSLERELDRAGFGDVRRARFNDSEDPKFLDVEDEGRWRDALGVECIA